ncbi:hypothetical protein B0T10DRAFT_554634 [Thelonectria olida]|uniref:HIT-type domain-containing protein n=1 Tax=Thelonectria olida TaxID=1576542 RepID=A0A9P8WIC4_9HYPO|nr:hypothetical protein B0T10DRAFT_554634 [Thelonectria olida]
MASPSLNNESELGQSSQDPDTAEPPAQTHDATVEADDSAPATKPKGSICGVCNVNASKYKCPRCYLPYCSVACNKTHHENHPPDPEPRSKPSPAPTQTQPLAPPSVSPNIQPVDPSNPFHALENSDKLLLLFQKYPFLPNQLLQIHAATLPPREPSDPKKAAIPASLLKGLPPKKEKWNDDIGIQNGKEALRKARRADGEVGEAIREYTELVLYLTNNNGDSGTDVTSLLRQKLSQQDNKLIERLMTEDKR